ncbi:hypothetical protein REPUB_Repub05bG0164400 [Reevesia pubescens]
MSLKRVIPSNLTFCSDLEFIDFSSNCLVGDFPHWLGNASSLVSFAMFANNIQGNIPAELGRLSTLQLLLLGRNNISGMVPSAIFNLSAMHLLDMANNQLHGKLPLDIGFTLPNLTVLNLNYNHITGPLPVSLLNASKLEQLNFVVNDFHGTLPPNIGNLSRLRLLSLGANQLETMELEGLSFLTSLTNCSNLYWLYIIDNYFKGSLPSEVGNLSSLTELDVSSNRLSRGIPSEDGMLVAGTDVKDLVYQFMQNGSLEDWLHPTEGQVGVAILGFIARLNIAIEVASAVEYLHHQC